MRGYLHLKSACCSPGDGKILANPAWLDVTPFGATGNFRVIPVPDDEPGAGPGYEHLATNRIWLLGASRAAWLVSRKRGLAAPLHLLPEWNWDTVGLLATIANAMSGFKMAGLIFRF